MSAEIDFRDGLTAFLVTELTAYTVKNNEDIAEHGKALAVVMSEDEPEETLVSEIGTGAYNSAFELFVFGMIPKTTDDVDLEFLTAKQEIKSKIQDYDYSAISDIKLVEYAGTIRGSFTSNSDEIGFRQRWVVSFIDKI